MRLYSIEYSEYKEETFRWNLEELSLININLVVGRNATGKSRLLRIINGLANFITGAQKPERILTGHFKVIFKDTPSQSKKVKVAKEDLFYEMEIFKGKVRKEILKVGAHEKLNRQEHGRGSIWFEKINDYIDIQVPENNLAVSVRRDTEQHNFFEDLHEWANNVRYYEFAIKDQNSPVIINKDIKNDILSSKLDSNAFHILVKFGKEKYSRNFLNAVITDMKRLNYFISDFGLLPLKGVQSPITNSGIPETLYIKEESIDRKLQQDEISAGMLRAFVTLCQLHIIRLEKKPSCILIDDIGEGLDFDRANNLIAIVIEQAENGHSQFLLTTNDRFVMNKVPLEYWCVLDRNVGKVQAYTPRNSPDTFKDFEEYGFNNFDFYSKSLFNQKIKNNE
jgi:predicted ATPase